MKRIIAVIAAASVFAAVPATASAGSYISKREARKYAVKEVRRMAARIEWADSWWVEPAYRCDRLYRHVVECEYDLSDEVEDITCESTVRIIATSDTTYRTRFPYEPDCY
jgi:hypothetical protein